MKNRVWRNRIIIGAIVLASIIVGIVFLGPKPPADPSSLFITEKVTRHDLTTVVNGNGQLTIVDKNDEQAIILISEYDIPEVRKRQKIELTIGAFETPLSGRVSAISDIVDTSTGVRSYAVTVDLPKLPRGSRAGMSVSAEITTGSVNDVIAIPVTAVNGSPGEYTVTVVRGTDIVTVTVVTGAYAGGLVEIESGLAVGDVLVIGTNGSLTSDSTSSGLLPPAPEGLNP